MKNLLQKLFLLLVLISVLFNFSFAGGTDLLPNGLKVLTVEMHNAPIIFSQLSYKVGSRNELLGKTGISHLAEHMMFKGTKKFSKEAVKKLIKNNGGIFNAFTSNDITSYWEQMPKNKIDIALEIESDRMHNCIFDPKEYLPERDVVIEERHMRTDDAPQGIFREELYAIAFKSHPLQNPIIGWPADLKAITRDDVYSYYKTYYTPNNATLVLVGDFQTDEMMIKVKKYFGKIPRGPEVPPVTSIEIDQANSREFTIHRPDVKAASLTIAFHGPALGDPDCAPLSLARQVMTGFRFSRLNKRIVHDLKLARQVAFRIDRGKDPGLIRFDIQAFAGEPDKLDQAKEIVFDEIERMQNELIDAYELEKIRNNQKYDEIFRNMKISSVASQLSTYETYHSWKHIEEWYQQLESVTREDIQRVMKKYFDPDKATYGYLLPGEAGVAEKPVAQAKKKNAEAVEDETTPETAKADLSEMEVKDLAKDIIPPQPFAGRIKTATLNNGIKIYGIEDKSFPIISLRGFIDTGIMPEEGQTPGVVSVLGSMLNRGTKQRNYEQLSEYKEFIPLGFSFSASHGSISFGGSSLMEKVDSLLALGKEMMFQPSFPQDELDKYRKDLISRLKSAEGGTGWKTSRFLFETVYQNHPYGKNPTGDSLSLMRITREQLIELHQKYLRPERATITIFGDFAFDDMVQKLNDYFGDWTKDSPFTYQEFPAAPATSGRIVKVIPMPEKQQVDIRIGYSWIAKNHPDEDGLDLVNYILGGSSLTSRLGESIRDKQGLAYGVGCDSRSRETGGIWWIQSKTEPKNVPQLIRSAFQVMEQMKQNGVTDKELLNAKSFLLRTLPMVIETPLDLDGLFTETIRTNSPLNSFDTYLERLLKIDKATVNALCRKYLNTENYVIVVAGDVEENLLDEFK